MKWFKLNNTNVSDLTDDERQRMRKAALIKIAAMGIFILVVMIFSSMQATTIQMTV